eukprot:scaffold142033_cov31-Prasinocladus_malaysianus.AAC.2
MNDCQLSLPCSWGIPRVFGNQPPGRIGGRMAILGDCAYMFGGRTTHFKCMGDLYRLKLVVNPETESADGANRNPQEAGDDYASLSLDDGMELLRSLKEERSRSLSSRATNQNITQHDVPKVREWTLVEGDYPLHNKGLLALNIVSTSSGAGH